MSASTSTSGPAPANSHRREAAAPASASIFFQPSHSDLYATYEDLRAHAPVHWDAMLGLWILSRYEDVRAVLGDKSFDPITLHELVGTIGNKMGRDYDTLARFLKAILFFQTGDEHRINRQSLSRVFTRLSLSEYEEIIRGFVAARIEAFAGQGAFDAYTDFAEAIPAFVMTRLLGLPEGDGPLLLRCARDLTRTFEPATPTLYARLNVQLGEGLELLKQRVREAHATDCGLAELYRSARSDGEERVSEVAAGVFAAFQTGTETTAAAIGNMVHHLIRNRATYDRLRSAPYDEQRVADEILRLESPVQRIGRIAIRDCEIGGHAFAAGDRVLLFLGSANRDPRQYDRPELLDESRRPSHLAFGGGKHHCLGASLARLEARLALEGLLQLPPLQFARPAAWYQGRTLHRFTSMPVTFSAP